MLHSPINNYSCIALVKKYIYLISTFMQNPEYILQESLMNWFSGCVPSVRDGVLRSGMLLYLHHRDSKISFHPAKFDNFKDEKTSDFKTVSVSQRKNLLD